MPTFERYDVVVVPFPFTEVPQRKRRPALVLSEARELGDRIGHGVMAMITSASNAPWPHDTAIEDLGAAGLSAPSVVRAKLFTLDHRLVIRRAGSLSKDDCRRVGDAMKTVLGA